MGRETDKWPFVQARYFKALTTPRKVRLVVVHDMEYAETLKAAEDVAAYFATMKDGRIASAHVCVDADSEIQCVHDRDIAYGAPGANSDGIHIELAGTQRQSHAEWLDPYGQRLLDRAANIIAQYCVKFDFAPVHLTDAQLLAGDPGIVGHDQVSRVYKQSDHTDPGPQFPWFYLMERVVPRYKSRLQFTGGVIT